MVKRDWSKHDYAEEMRPLARIHPEPIQTLTESSQLYSHVWAGIIEGLPRSRDVVPILLSQRSLAGCIGKSHRQSRKLRLPYVGISGTLVAIHLAQRVKHALSHDLTKSTWGTLFWFVITSALQRSLKSPLVHVTILLLFIGEHLPHI